MNHQKSCSCQEGEAFSLSCQDRQNNRSITPCGCGSDSWRNPREGSCGCGSNSWRNPREGSCGCGSNTWRNPREGSCGCGSNTWRNPREGSCGCSETAVATASACKNAGTVWKNRSSCTAPYVEPRTVHGCAVTCAQGAENDGALNGKSLAMVYSPHQDFTSLYDPRQGLCRGTVFCELDKPFHGQRRGC